MRDNSPITIIGAGLAGASAAYALTRNGHFVTVLEQASHAATGASGNPAAILYPPTTKHWGASMQLGWSGLGYTQHLVRELISAGHSIAHDWCGVLMIPKDADDLARHTLYAEQNHTLSSNITQVDAKTASNIAGIPITTQCLHLPQSGWLSIPDLCHAMLSHANITVHYNENITSLPEKGITILTNGHQANELLPKPVEIARNRGQISFIPEGKLQPAPTTVLCQHGYVTPSIHGQHSIGATYSREESSLALRNEDHLTNHQHLITINSDWQNTPTPNAGRAAFRATTPDRLPIVGKISDTLYISTGHGSRGAITAPLSGAILAAMLSHTPLPAPNSVIHAIRPYRFVE